MRAIRWGRVPVVVGVAVWAAAVFSSAPQAAQAGADRPEAAASLERTVTQYCATCHGISEEKSPLPEATRFRIVADRPGMTALALQVWMQTSHPTMPNIIVAPKDMRNVIAYIISLKGREAAKP